ncbi:MAG: hypothetical protein K0R98_1516 [Rickettsiaceae bacterium]|jgi:hypothetical protein|nr:hypothetical protein [Rickettsiaceae bacterium]
MKKLTSAVCITALLANLTGCGTILHPERVGQRGGGQLDPSIVVLDGIGLLFFLIPGVIAYAVDFSNGTIYMGHGGGKKRADVESFDTKDMTALHVGKENLTPEKIREVVSANAGHDVDTDHAQAYKPNGEKVKVM